MDRHSQDLAMKSKGQIKGGGEPPHPTDCPPPGKTKPGRTGTRCPVTSSPPSPRCRQNPGSQQQLTAVVHQHFSSRLGSGFISHVREQKRMEVGCDRVSKSGRLAKPVTSAAGIQWTHILRFDRETKVMGEETSYVSISFCPGCRVGVAICLTEQLHG